ncbi:ABC transporter permease [Streptomyces sp. NPDC000594]|uniref:ABC transporter permease n=1 Tax=Streptomyces sp. NPDC000594 TaxID=3154261 RepID=UPI00332D67E3
MTARRNGLARAAIRFKPSAFAGTFIALLLTSAIVTACGILLESGVRASVPPQRYTGAPVVVEADQRAHLWVGSGEDRHDSYTDTPDRARLDHALTRKAAAVPGVAAAIPDIAFPVRAQAGGLTAYGWGSTAFTGTEPETGRAPRTGEAVTGPGGPRTGERITLETPGGTREFRVSGTVADPGRGVGPGSVWLSDTDALALSGHPGKIDAIAVLPEPGTAAATVADRLGEVFGSGHYRPKVRTGDDRGAVEDRGLAAARETLIGLGGSFGGVATLVSVFTAAGTVALSVGLRRREFALLRAIGATPRQVRRSIATEALLIAPLAGAIGCLPGIALASWWFGQLREKGALPRAVELHIGWIPPLVAVAAVVLTALCAGFLAARKPSRIRPGQALADASVERVGFAPIRTPLGLVAVGGGVALAGLAAQTSGNNAANAALGVVMLFMLAVALLGPLIARACAALFGLPLRAAGAPGSLAAANSRSNARRLASAITPIVLATAFSSVLLFLHTSTDRAIEEQQREGITADRIVVGKAGGPLPLDAAGQAARVPGVSAAVSLTQTSVVVTIDAGPEASLATATTQGYDGRVADLARVQDLQVVKGSLDSLRPGRIALDERVADSAGVTVGERFAFHLPDGTKSSAEVVAVYGRGLGLAEVTLPVSVLRPHLTSPYPGTVLVRASDRATEGLTALGTVQDRAGFTAGAAEDRELNSWANHVMAAVLGGFAAVAAANTLVMTVLDRRRELTMLRLVGSTRRQVLGMIRWEALLVTFAGIALGTAIAFATLIPMVRGITGGSPYVPPMLYGSLALAVVVLGVASAVLPARAATR